MKRCEGREHSEGSLAQPLGAGARRSALPSAASGCPLPSSWGTAGEPTGTEQHSVLSQCPAETVLRCPKLQSSILLFLGTRAGGTPAEVTLWCCLGIHLAHRRAHLTTSEPRSAFLQKSPSARKTLPQRAAHCLPPASSI